MTTPTIGRPVHPESSKRSHHTLQGTDFAVRASIYGSGTGGAIVESAIGKAVVSVPVLPKVYAMLGDNPKVEAMLAEDLVCAARQEYWDHGESFPYALDDGRGWERICMAVVGAAAQMNI